MTYHDFQILSNEEYKILESHYNNSNNFSKNNIINSIYNNLTNAKTSLQQGNTINNYQLKKELNNHFFILNKLEDNLKSIFSLEYSKPILVESFNLFNYVKNLFSIIKLLNTWQEHENKEYYKKTIKFSKFEIENLISNILSILSTLSINFYKFM